MRDAGSPCHRPGTGGAVSPDVISSVTKLTTENIEKLTSKLVIQYFTHNHLTVSVSLSLFSMSLRHL